MKNLLMVCVMVANANICVSQSKNFWREVTATSDTPTPNSARTLSAIEKHFSLDFTGLRHTLIAAPIRKELKYKSHTIISIPDYQGNIASFKIAEAPVMHPDLAARFPGIKTYIGYGVENKNAEIHFTISDEVGFHGLMTVNDEITYIHRLANSDQKYSFMRGNGGNEAISCTIEEKLDPANLRRSEKKSQNGRLADQQIIHKYRIAIACDAEFGENILSLEGASNASIAVKQGILMQGIAYIISNVRRIYERDLGVTLELVPNEGDILFFGDSSIDPWDHDGDVSTELEKTQELIDSKVGVNNYDIGHLFRAADGYAGRAFLNIVCSRGNQAKGISVGLNPYSNDFANLIAHEMGHQFSAQHTFTCPDGGEMGSPISLVEPGSGSTIMSYAGACNAVQADPDSYFHWVSIKQMSDYIQQIDQQSGCGIKTSIANKPPVIDAGQDYTIPKSTPFALKAKAIDPEGYMLLQYTWEQIDAADPGHDDGIPVPTKINGPLFRSLPPSYSNIRYFPKPEVLANNLPAPFEVLPSVARQLNFALTVRDSYNSEYQVTDDQVTLTVDDKSGPFVVTSPNASVAFPSNSYQTITWNIANTNVAPVNCSKVNILLSTNGGIDFSTVLLSNTPNDGRQQVKLPSITATNCRIKVEAADNVFFDISDANFGIGVTCVASAKLNAYVNHVTVNSAMLNWPRVATGATYQVQYKPAASTDWVSKTVRDQPTASAMSVTLTSLNANTLYVVQIKPMQCVNGEFTTLKFLTGENGYSLEDLNTLIAIDIACDKENKLNWDNDANVSNWQGVTWDNSQPKRVTKIDVSEKNLRGEINVSKLTELTSLDCYTNMLTAITGNPKLTELNCMSNQILSLDLTKCPKISKAYIAYNKIQTLTVTGLQNLTTLICSGNTLTDLDISNLPALETLFCRDNQLSRISINGCDALKIFDCSNNRISSLELSQTKIERLYCANNGLTYFSLPASLLIMDCSHNALAKLDLSNQPLLTSLNCTFNNLSSIVASNYSLLSTHCEYNNLPFTELLKIRPGEASSFSYSPQNTIFSPVTAAPDIRIDYSSQGTIDGINTMFYFYKNGTLMAINSIGKYVTSGYGTYSCTMTNGIFPGLTLTTADVSIVNPTVLRTAGTAFEEIATEEKNVILYPNPGKTTISIHLKSEKIKTLSVFSLNGEFIRSNEVESSLNADLNVADLPSGSYLLKIITYHTIIVKRIMVER